MTKIRSPLLARSIHKLFKLYWLIFHPDSLGVKVVAKTPDGRFLLVRLTYYPNSWTFPGGGVKKGEELDDAAQRELKEETSLFVDKNKLRLMGPMEFNHENKKDTIYIFSADSAEIEPIIDGMEVAEAGWFHKSDFPFMGPNAQKIFEFYERNRFKQN